MQSCHLALQTYCVKFKLYCVDLPVPVLCAVCTVSLCVSLCLCPCVLCLCCVTVQTKRSPRTGFSLASKAPQLPALYHWICKFYHTLLSKVQLISRLLGTRSLPLFTAVHSPFMHSKCQCRLLATGKLAQFTVLLLTFVDRQTSPSLDL